MNILIVTQKMDRNDSVLGFFHRWVEEFAKRFEEVIVVCLWEGEHDLPPNVRVISLGKDRGGSRLSYLARFLGVVFRERSRYDAVFVHMNPLYVILAGALWRWWGKPVGLWYTHRSVDWRLKLAEVFTEIIFTASKESFRLESGKVAVMGHGIDARFFDRERSHEKRPFTVLSVGRLSPVKRHEVVLAAFNALVKRNVDARLRVVGGALSREDDAYLRSLKAYARERGIAGKVEFAGAVPYEEMPRELARADALVNASATGSVDKAVLEAICAGLIPVASNEAFAPLLAPYELFVKNGEAEGIADALEGLMDERRRRSVLEELKAKVMQEHDLASLIERIAERYAALAKRP